jgi:DNA-binding CsgD family transcriptional regulator
VSNAAPAVATVPLVEVLAAVSVAADVGHDQPLEKSLRNAVIASRLGLELELGREDQADAFFVALLRSMGCTANAHETAALMGGDKEIGAQPYLSPRTVQHHLAHIYDKVDRRTRAGAAMFAMEHDLVGHSGARTWA